MTMTCTNCNAEIGPDDMFCGECGAKVESGLERKVETTSVKSDGAEVQENIGIKGIFSALFLLFVSFFIAHQVWYNALQILSELQEYFELEMAWLPSLNVYSKNFAYVTYVLVSAIIVTMLHFILSRFPISRTLPGLPILLIFTVIGAVTLVTLFYATGGGFWASFLFLASNSTGAIIADTISIAIICALLVHFFFKMQSRI